MASEDGSMDSHERGHWVDQQFENFVDCVARCLPCGRADFLRYYEVPKVAKIYAPPLQLPILFCQTLVTILALGFLIISLHLYEDVAVVSSTHTFDISFPQRNFDACHDVDFDCDDVGKSDLTREENEKASSYCNEATLHELSNNMEKYFFSVNDGHNYSRNRWHSPPKLHPECKNFDVHGVFREDGPAPLIMTAQSIFSQKSCETEPSMPRCIWENDNVRFEIVYDVERFLVKLRHDVVLDDGRRVESTDATGFMHFQADPNSLYVVKCDPGKKDCDYSLPSHADFPPCGNTSSQKDSPCFSTGFADFISLEILLRAANTSLDEIVSDLPRRWWGTYLQVDIRYSNDDLQDYWLGSPGQFSQLQLRTRYVYSVRKLTDYVWNSQTISSSDTERTLVRHAGIRISVNVHGSLKAWSWLNVFRTLAIFGVLWKITVVMVDVLMLALYRQIPTLRHLPHLRHYYSVTETPHHDHMKKLSHEQLELEKKRYREMKLQKIIQDEEEDELAAH
ncbi:unnamed protein product [Symbiodinium necroappetens]|uniref:Uncharacterized protein n=1 Tax=Symbiodinium necroappetens TaxID=1628268 RepID=A0A812W4P7_9DINO|nr:unnamed protein product [Symbiodinium necroappetens]